MYEFLLYVALPVLVAIAGTCAVFAIRDAKQTALAASETLPRQPKPIRDARFYQVNGHWIFGVVGKEWDNHAIAGRCRGECDKHGV